MSRVATNAEAPDAIAIQVAERCTHDARYLRCEIGSDLQFSTDSLVLLLRALEPAAHDALLVARPWSSPTSRKATSTCVDSLLQPSRSVHDLLGGAARPFCGASTRWRS
jgi:hypothetical protein